MKRKLIVGIWMIVLLVSLVNGVEYTFYTTAGDGYIQEHDGVGTFNWDNVHDAGEGSDTNYVSTTMRTMVQNVTSTVINRMFIPINTTSLTQDDKDNIENATFNFKVSTRSATQLQYEYIVIVGNTSQVSISELVDADYNESGSINNPVEYSNRLAPFNFSGNTWYQFTINQDGINSIKNGDVTRWGIRYGFDTEDVPFSALSSYVWFYTSESPGNEPYLTINSNENITTVELTVNNYGDDDPSAILHSYCTMNEDAGYSDQITYTHNPAEDNVLSCTMSGYEPFNAVLNASPTEYNFTMELINGNIIFSEPTSGYLQDDNTTWSFSGSSLDFNVSELVGDYSVVSFNFVPGTDSANYTWCFLGTCWIDVLVNNTVPMQFVMIDNNLNSFDRNIRVLSTQYITDFHVKIYDTSSTSLEDALIIVYQTYNNESGGSDRAITNILYTPDTGQVKFGQDYFQSLIIDVTAEGYRTKTVIIPAMDHIIDSSNSESNPYIIILEEDDSTGYWEGSQLYLPRQHYDKVTTIEGLVYAPFATKVEFKTDYKSTLEEVSDDGMGRFVIYLESGVEYDASGSNDIDVFVYIDDELAYTHTIDYAVYTDIATIPSLDDNWEMVLLFIGLMVVVALVNYISADKWGYGVFFIGSMLLTLFNIGFAWLAVTVSAHYILKGVFNLISQ